MSIFRDLPGFSRSFPLQNPEKLYNNTQNKILRHRNNKGINISYSGQNRERERIR